MGKLLGWLLGKVLGYLLGRLLGNLLGNLLGQSGGRANGVSCRSWRLAGLLMLGGVNQQLYQILPLSGIDSNDSNFVLF